MTSRWSGAHKSHNPDSSPEISYRSLRYSRDMNTRSINALVQKALPVNRLEAVYPLSRKTPVSLKLPGPSGVQLRNPEPVRYIERFLQRSYTNTKRDNMVRADVVRTCMLPSIKPDTIIYYEERQYLGGLLDPAYPQRGEIVCFWNMETGEGMIKRLIGLPKEEIEISNERLFIDGRPAIEPYPVLGMEFIADMRKVLVPKKHIFVLADNRLEICDSRQFGPLHISFVFGIVREILK